MIANPSPSTGLVETVADNAAKSAKWRTDKEWRTTEKKEAPRHRLGPLNIAKIQGAASRLCKLPDTRQGALFACVVATRAGKVSDARYFWAGPGVAQ